MTSQIKITTAASMYSIDAWTPGGSFHSLFATCTHVEVIDKSKAPCFSMAWFKEARRKKKDIEAITGLVYDFDSIDAPSVSAAITQLKNANITGVVYTTFSHKSDGATEKYRVVIPFNAPVTNPDQRWFAAFHAFMARELNFINYDATCDQMERMYFMPSKLKGSPVPVVYHYNDAELLMPILDVDVLLPTKKTQDTQDTTNSANPSAQKSLWLATDAGDSVDLRQWFDVHSDVDVAELIKKLAPDLIVSDRDSGGYHIECPNKHQHSNHQDGDKACFCAPASEDYTVATISCLHAHCAALTTADFVFQMINDGVLTFADLTAAAEPSNVLDFPLEGITVQVRNSYLDNQKEDENVFATTALAKPEYTYDKALFKSTILDDAQLADTLFTLTDTAVLHAVLGDGVRTQEQKDFIVAFTAVPLDVLADEEMLTLDVEYIKWLRLKCRSVVTAVRKVISVETYVTDYSESINKLSAIYGLEYDEICNVFTAIRSELLTATNFRYTSVAHTAAFLAKFKELDAHYRRISKSILSKQAYTGVVYCDTRRLKNIIIPESGVFSEEELHVSQRSMNVFDTAAESALNVVLFWLSLPFLYPIIEKMQCTPVHGYGNIEDQGAFNTYDPTANVAAVACDTDTFYHTELPIFREILADGDQDAFMYMLTWAAHAQQFTAKKMPTCLFFEGIQGSGKSILIKALFVQPHGVFGVNVANKNAVFANFNALLAGKHMVFYDEVSETVDFKNDGELKYFITSDKIRIEPKGVDAIEIDSFHHLVMASNNHNVVVLDDYDRRLSYFKVASTYHNAPSFWKPRVEKYKSELFTGQMKHFLMTFDPEKYGSSWDIITRPLENSERFDRISSIKNTADRGISFLLEGKSLSVLGKPDPAGFGYKAINLSDGTTKTDEDGYASIPVDDFAGAVISNSGFKVTSDTRTVLNASAYRKKMGIKMTETHILIPMDKIKKDSV